MNLRKSILSVFAAAALTLSIAAPIAIAADTVEEQSSSNVSVNEGGKFTFDFWASAITFNPATVDTNVPQTVTQNGDNHRVLMVNDTHAYSNGYVLQMTASDLTVSGTGYFIDNDNLSVRKAGGGPHSSCLWSGAPAPVGGNPYQSITFDLGDTYKPLSGVVSLITGSTGRGCGGPFQSNYTWELTVPAGTYTGGGSAEYSGKITITTMAEVDG